MLTIIDTLPDGFLDVEASNLHEILAGPTLIHLPGRQPRPLFVSILLHGNEITGLLTIQKLLAHYRDRQLPRALSIFVGNVEAARRGLRRLDNAPDYNRIWAGGPLPEHAMAQQILNAMAHRSVFASVDIHNNTGRNPHYSCITKLDAPFQQLASLFGRTTVYFTQPKTVQSAAFAQYCPSMVLECGQPGHPHGTQHAFELVDACLHISHFPEHPVEPEALDLFHTVAVVKIPPFFDFAFGDKAVGTDICLPEALDKLNFSELPSNTLIATYHLDKPPKFHVTDEDGVEVGDRYFSYRDGEVRTKRSFMPAMLTLDSRIIRQDCFCYVMERYPLSCRIDYVA